MKSVLADCGAKEGVDLIALSGSMARQEATFASDVELFLIGPGWREVETSLQRGLQAHVGIDLDMYAVTDIDEIELFLAELPDYFIDFANAKVLLGNQERWKQFREEVAEVAAKPGFLSAVVRKRQLAPYEEPKQDFTRGLLKKALNAWSAYEAVGRQLDFALALPIQLKHRLLYYKSTFECAGEFGVEPELGDTFRADVQECLEMLRGAYSALVSQTCMHKYVRDSISIDTAGSRDQPALLRRFGDPVQDESPTEQQLASVVRSLPQSVAPVEQRLVDRGSGSLFYYAHSDSPVIDLASMTMNCILGQGDPWVKFRQMSFLSGSAPSFLPSRLVSNESIQALYEFSRPGFAGMQSPIVSARQCNGADAVELAVQAAYALRGSRTKLVSFEGAYHGQNLTSYLVSERQQQHRFLVESISANVVWLPAPPPDKAWAVPEFLEERHLSAMEMQILSAFESVAQDAYAIVVEPIQCNNGMRTLSLPLMRALRKIAADANVCFIVDEVQTGCGWTGRMTASEAYGVTPDAVCLGKALTAGYGSAAFTIWNGKHWDVLPYGTTEKTNGANPLALVAIRAVLERLWGVPDHMVPPVLLSDDFRKELRVGLIHGISKLAKLIESCFHDLVCEHPAVIEGGAGFMLLRGLRIKPCGGKSSEVLVKEIVAEALSQGVLVRSSRDAITIKPPLVISRSVLFEGFRRLDTAIRRVTHSS